MHLQTWEVIIFLGQLFQSKFYQFKAMFDTPLLSFHGLHHFQTLYCKPRSSPQVTMTLPEEARKKHYQDQIFVCCQSKPNAWIDSAVSAVTVKLFTPHTDWYLLSSIYYRWSRDQISQHRWQSLPQQHLLFQEYVAPAGSWRRWRSTKSSMQGTPTAISGAWTSSFLRATLIFFLFFRLGNFYCFIFRVTYAFFCHIPPPLGAFPSESLNISYYCSQFHHFHCFIFSIPLVKFSTFSLVSRVFVTAWWSIFMMHTLHLHQIIPTSNSAQCGHLLIVFSFKVWPSWFLLGCVIILLYPEHFRYILH